MENNTVSFHPHPLYIVSILRKMIFLLLAPLLRSIFSALSGGLNGWLQGAWLDILMVLLFFLGGAVIWYRFVITAGPEGFTVSRGILFCTNTCIPLNKCSCITAIAPFYLKPFHAVRFRVDTPGGNIQKADLALLLHQRSLEKILPLIGSVPLHDHRTKVYTPKNSYVLFLSAITSNSFAGVLMVSAFITQAGNILGAEFADQLYGTFEEATRLLAFGIPPAAAALAYVLFFGWVLAFLFNAARHLNLKVRRNGSLLEITGGLLSPRRYLLSRQNIGFLDIRQTFLTYIFHLSSVFVYSVGYGKYRDELDAIIPYANRRHLKNRLSLLLPEFQPSSRQLSPAKNGLLHLPPLPYSTIALVFALLCAFAGVYTLFPGWSPVIAWGFLFALAPALWYLAVRTIDAFTCGVSYQKHCYTLRYSKGFHLHTVLIMENRISNVFTVQNIFQRVFGRCDLLVFSYTEGVRFHRIRNLPAKEAFSLFNPEKRK